MTSISIELLVFFFIKKRNLALANKHAEMRRAIYFATHIKLSAKKHYNPVHVGDLGKFHIDSLGHWGNNSMATLGGQKHKFGELVQGL